MDYPNDQGQAAGAIPVYAGSAPVAFKQRLTGMAAANETVLLRGMPIPSVVTFLTTSGNIQLTTVQGGIPFTPQYDDDGTVSGQIVLTLFAAPYSITFNGAVGDKWSIG